MAIRVVSLIEACFSLLHLLREPTFAFLKRILMRRRCSQTSIQRVTFLQQHKVIHGGTHFRSIANTFDSLSQSKVTYLQPSSGGVDKDVLWLYVAMD